MRFSRHFSVADGKPFFLKFPPMRKLLFITALCAVAPALHAADALVSSTAPVAVDANLNAEARLLAGRDPGLAGYERLTTTEAWKSHRAFFEENWTKARETRFDKASAWRDRELNIPASATTTLMYPFSGPDFLNARLFFPKADRYIFYSLEPTGALPDLASMDGEEFAALLKDIRDSLGDIFKRHYFITKKMNEEFRTPYLKGNRTVLLVFLALTDNDIVSLEDVSLNANGDPVPLSSVETATRPVKGLKILFRPAGEEKARTLYYYSLDVSDKGLKKHPEFLLFLAKNAPAAAFLKSASYLLHDEQFSKIRRAILDTTDFLMEDDSGMPYRFLPAKEWDVTLYGKYTKPIKDFNYGYQEDLAKAYEAPGAAKSLPFKFGYHWWDGYSNVLTAVRKKSP